jgi:protein-disulfide isomerase
MLFVVTVASILSIFLFCVSEFVIGALCLMCIGLYVVNFLLLAVTWRTGFSGSFFAGLYGGVQNLVKFLIEAFTGSWRALCAFIMLVILAAVSAFSPQVILMLAERPKPPREISDADVFESWKAAEVTDPRVAVTGEAFGDYAEGPESAPIQIVEFADFECPGCRAMYVALREQLQRFNGLYRIVFKNYPLDRECNPNIARDFHRSACFAVMLTRCAGEQGKFWDALHAAFTDPALEQEGDVQEHRDELVEHTVDGLSLDRDAIKECISSGRYKAKILEDIKEGDRLGLFSTPSFWINGKPVIPATLGGMDLIFNAIVAEEGITPNAGQSSEPR